MSVRPSRGLLYHMKYGGRKQEKTSVQTEAISIDESTGPRNVTNDNNVLCWISAGEQEWGKYKLKNKRDVKVGIIRLDFKLDEPKDVQISKFDLDIEFSSGSATPSNTIGSTATVQESAKSTLYVFGEPHPSHAEGPFSFKQNEWDLRFNPNITVLGSGGSFFDVQKSARVSAKMTWRFQASSRAIDNEKRGTRWQYEVFDFEQAGANRGPWKGAVAIVHSDQAIQAKGHLKLKAYRRPRHLRAQQALPQFFVFQPQVTDNDLSDLTTKLESLKKEIDDTYKAQKIGKDCHIKYNFVEC